MAYVDYVLHRPQTLHEACELGDRYAGDVAFLAGGTELLVDLRSGRKRVAQVVSLAGLPELRGIDDDGRWLTIGALSTLGEVAASPIVRDFYAPLCEAIRMMAGVQIRNLGTIGGNFCCAVPCSDTPPISIVAGAEVVVAGRRGERALPATELCLAPRITALQRDEILRAIRIPAQPDGSGASYQRFGLRKGMSLSVAAVAARVDLVDGVIDSARIVMGSVAPVPLAAEGAVAAVVGREPGAEVFTAAAKIAAAEAQPISDLRGSEQYRRELVEVLTTKALTVAAERAAGGAA